MVEEFFTRQVEEVARLLKKASSVLFITGAGISADSGLPTYRGITGLYDNQDTEDGISIESALSGSMLRANPEMTWKYISQIEEACRGKSFNRGHEVIAQMEPYFDRVCVLTQNVDGFHHKAGSTNIIDIHGDIHDLYCLNCDYKQRVVDFGEINIPPVCPTCSRLLRPDVVLFEETLSISKTNHLSSEMRKGFDIIFSVGTTSVFPYIAQPVAFANANNIPTVEINPAKTVVSEMCDVKISDTAAKTLNFIWMTYRRG